MDHMTWCDPHTSDLYLMKKRRWSSERERSSEFMTLFTALTVVEKFAVQWKGMIRPQTSLRALTSPVKMMEVKERGKAVKVCTV